MDINTEAKIKLGVDDQASKPVRDLRREVDKTTKSVIDIVTNLNKIKPPALQSFTKPSTAKATAAFSTGGEAVAMAGLKKRWSFEARMSRQRADEAKAEERSHRLFEAAAVRDLRERMTVSSRLARQRTAEAENAERLRRSVETDAMSGLRRQMATSAALARQRITDTRSAERERQRIADGAERDAASALRNQVAGHRYLFGLRQRQDRQEQAVAKARGREIAGGRRDIGHGLSDMGQGASRAYGIAQSAATVGAVAQAAVAKAVESAFASRMKVETAETNLRMFGSTLARPGQSAKAMSAADVAEIRATWLDEASVGAGVAPEVGIKTYTEVLKAGIADDRAREMTELVLKGSAGMDMDAAATTRVLGRMSTVMGGKDGVSSERMQKVMTGMAIAASETAANPDEIVSGMSRGMGALAYGMTPEDLAAWVATGASTGIQAGKTGNFVSTLLQNGIGAKNQRGQKLKDMDTAASMVGMGSAQSMSRTAAKDPNAFLETMFERVERLSVEKRAKFSRLMGGQEWDDEILQMKQGLETLKKTRAAIKDERNRNFLDDNKDLKNASLSGLWARLKSRFSLLWESFGHGFSDTFSEVGTWFISSGRAVNLAGLRSVGASLMTGIVNGLGFKNWTALLNRVFGEAGKIDWGAINQTVTRFAEGLGAGIRSMATWARDILGIAGGSGFDARTLGKVTAGFLGLAAGLIVIAPVVGLLGIAAGGLRLLAGGVGVLNGALTAMGVGGLTGAGAKLLGRMGFGAFASGAAGLGIRAAGAAALAGLTIVGGGILLAGLAGIGALYVAVTNWDVIKGWISGGTMTDPDRKAAEDRLNDQQGGDSLASKMWNWFNQSGDTATVQRQSYGGEHNGAFDRRGLIQNASFNAQDRSYGGFRGFDGGQLIRAALIAPGTGAGAIAGMGASPGAGATAGFPGIGGARGTGGGGPAVPGWFGKGGNPGNLAAPQGPVGDRMRGVYAAFKAAGLSHEASKSFTAEIGRENDFNPGLMYGSHVDPHNGKRNAGIMSWQGDRAEKLLARLREGGHLNADGTIKHTQESLNAQARFAVDEMKNGALGPRGQRAFGVLNDPNATHAQRALALGDDVIKWRQHDPRYASHAQKRDRYYGQVGGLTEGGTDAGAFPGSTAGATGGAANAVDVARRFLGMDEDRDHGTLKKFMGREIRGAQNAWCAAFVNSSLQAVGLKGTGSAVANSFLGWGKGVDAKDVQKGDVAVEHRGEGVNAIGGHVGMATGNKRVNPKTGELEVEVIQGNSGNKVKTEWENASKLALRRSTDPKAAIAASPEAQKAVDGFRSTGWKNAVPAPTGAVLDQASDLLKPGQGFGAKAPSAEDLAKTVPMPAPRGRSAGAPGLDAGGTGFQRQGGAGGGGPQAPISITINGANRPNAELAGDMQRHITEAWNFRSHDLEPELT